MWDLGECVLVRVCASSWEGRCKKPFSLISVNSGQGGCNAEARGGEPRTGFLPCLSMCSVLFV